MNKHAKNEIHISYCKKLMTNLKFAYKQTDSQMVATIYIYRATA